MREIKFRGFSYEKMSWLSGNLIEKDDPTKEQQTPWVRLIHNRALSADMVVFESVGQFTGLNDKNGIDIYEGDVCKILYTDWPSKSNDDSRTIEQYMDDIAKIGVIEYSQDGFYFVTKDRHGELNYSHILPGKHGFVKVIGNVYQNPELLK